MCTVKAVRTNTPLHALATLNDTTYVEAARMLAQRVLGQGSSTEESIAAAFRLAVSRRPTAREGGILLGTYKRLHAQFAADPKAAENLLSAGEAPRDARLDVTEHAAMTGVCTLILNLDEMLTRQ